ncbi:MAG: VWA domain-containing protein [Candidatus Hydrogenedens sp.]|nr:VWA domain-containing protein [Candidatus Hydrogenedens sp.]
MVSRRSLMTVSFVITAVIYAVMLGAAPYVTLMEANRSVPMAMDLLRVQVREVEPQTAVVPPEPAAALASRPGSMEDLLTRADDSPQEAQALPEEGPPAEIPDLMERVASDPVAREHDLSHNPEAADRADAKIIEIARETARSEVDVPRRLVRPSPDRILEPGFYPALRSEAADPGDIPLEPATQGVNLLAQTANIPGGEGGAPVPAESAPPPPLPEPVRKAIERPMADVPLQREVEAAKTENDYAFLYNLVDIKISTYRPPGEELGYFELQIQPKTDEKLEILPKDITFVIDASRSMQQRKLDLAARGLSQVIQRLRSEDMFNLVIFRDTPAMLQQSRVPATEQNKAAALNQLKSLESRGQTDVYSAVHPVVMEPPRTGIPGIVLVVSDFRPTTGLQDNRTIINTLSNDNNLLNSIFAFGAGNTVNRYTMDLLAYRNKGRGRIAPNIESTATDLPVFFDEFSDPLLVDIRVDYGRIDKNAIFPKVIPDFYRKGAVTVYGRFDPKNDREFVMRMTGRAWNREKELVFRAKLADAAQGSASIPGNWAFAKSYHLIGEISRQGETPELLGQIRELSRKYNIRTTYDQ